jgi:hypothetical protein
MALGWQYLHPNEVAYQVKVILQNFDMSRVFVLNLANVICLKFPQFVQHGFKVLASVKFFNNKSTLLAETNAAELKCQILIEWKGFLKI